MKIANFFVVFSLINLGSSSFIFPEAVQDRVKEAMRSTEYAMDQARYSLLELRTKISHLDVKKVDKLIENIDKTIENLDDTMKEINEIAKNVKKITEDVKWLTENTRKIISFPSNVVKRIIGKPSENGKKLSEDDNKIQISSRVVLTNLGIGFIFDSEQEPYYLPYSIIFNWL